MKRSILVYSIIGIISLAACSRDDSETSKAKLSCNSEQLRSQIQQQIQTNAPLLFGKTDFIAHLNQQLQGNEVTLHDNVFSKPIQYAPVSDNTNANAASVTNSASKFDQTGIQTLSTVLGNALLPYGIKDTVMIAGHMYNRADAIKLITNPNAQVLPLDRLSPEAQKASDILNGHSLATESNNQADNNHVIQNDITTDQLQQARDNNRNANSVINAKWHNLNDTVRNTLQQEEQKWIVQKTSQCQAKRLKLVRPLRQN